jgi:transposase
MWSVWPATPSMSADAGSSWTPAGTEAARQTRSTLRGARFIPGLICSPTSRRTRLQALFAVDAHVEVEATWSIYQRTVAAYREHNRAQGRTMMQTLINALSNGVPKALHEAITLGRTLNKRAADILAYFDRPGTSNGPTEAINRRLEHLRGSALGFRNLTNYIARSLLESGGFRPRLHPQS